MAKNKVNYVCAECGEVSVKWMGQCPTCRTWNSFKEFRETAVRKSGSSGGRQLESQSLATAESDAGERISTGLDEMNTLLGGGFVRGAVILIGGEPGVGKSTLLLKMNNRKSRILYITGEESLEQVKNRAGRTSTTASNLSIIQSNSLADILTTLRKEKPDIVYIDSIQTVYDENTGLAGSVSQIREASAALISYAKNTSAVLVMTGHITKDGQIAGPKLLEHAVDVVLYFESHRSGMFRFIRSVKNRYGPTGEVAVFEMTGTGLVEKKPGENTLHLEESGGAGSIIFPQREGSRIIPLEIQVLVAPAGYSTGRRIGENIELSRIHLIAAILEKYLSYRLSQSDIFVRVQGGTAMRDTAGDLALLLAMASSFKDVPIPAKTAAAGEISLTGVIRPVAAMQIRRKAVKTFGLEHAFWGGAASEKEEGLNEEWFSSVAAAVNRIIE